MDVASDQVQIIEYGNSGVDDGAISLLLHRACVQSGFTGRALAKTLFAPNEVKRRCRLILAKSNAAGLAGMVVCAAADNPYRQIANGDEAEMPLREIAPETRKHGAGKPLRLAFESVATSLGYRKAVLSTQPAMHAAQRLYEALGYQWCAARD